MNSHYSQSIVAQSQVSMRSQELVDNASRIANIKIKGIEGLENEDTVAKSWGALGLYISRQMRMGRGIFIPHFGTFTFSAPSVLLDGVTNPNERDKQLRRPVFLVSKDFAKGKDIKAGIYIQGHLRPYSSQTSGSIQQTKVNWSEIAHYAQQTKDATKFAIDKLLRVIADRCRKDSNVDMEFPGVGVFHVRNNIAAVQFYDHFVSNTQGIAKRPLSERKTKGNMNLTKQSIEVLNFQNTLKQKLPTMLEQSGEDFLKNSFNLNVEEFKSLKQIGDKRPNTAGARSYYSNNLMAKSLLERNVGAPKLIKPDMSLSQTNFKRTLTDLEEGMKLLKLWIRQNYYNSEDAFLNCCNNAFGRTKEKKIKMNLQQFETACENMELNLNKNQVQVLFNALDVNKNGFINYEDWKQVHHDDNTHLNYIKDAIFKSQLHADDVIKTMGFHREHNPINKVQLVQGLLALDLLLDAQKAEQVAYQILKGNQTVSMQTLIEVLDCVEEDDKTYDASWFKDTLYKIKEKMVNSNNYKGLRKLFEQHDEQNIGSLDDDTFKKCLMKSYLNLSVIDIKRIVRYLPKVPQSRNRIDYFNFLRMIDRVDVVSTSDQKVGDIYEFAEKIDKYLRQQKLGIQVFLKTIRQFSLQQNIDEIGSEGQVTVQQVTEYLYRFIFNETQKHDLDMYTHELDVDSDGYVTENDVQSFLQKHNYFEHVYHAPPIATRDLIKPKIYTKDIVNLNSKGLFPNEPLPEWRVDKVLRDLKKNLEIKQMSSETLFSMLDKDKDGFITILEFSENIEKVLPLSQAIKDGFFAYMDKLHIGMVDYNHFMKLMKKPVTEPEIKLTPDNFDWQLDMIMRVREWFAKEKLTVEDAFRTLDKNYQGEIREKDLHDFLIEQIKVKEEELNKGRINRLFKLMDQFKRGRINCQDFRRFLCEDFSQGQHSTIMGHKVIDNYSSFDWKLNAIQQIGLILTRRFIDLDHSFNIISGYRKQLYYNQFKNWIKNTDALRGFDISETLLQELFSDLDSHKKGHLTEQDWRNAFGGFDWKRQMEEEIIETIYKNFDSVNKAFQFFVQGNSQQLIDYQGFKSSINYLFPRRFIDSDIEDMWMILSQGNKTANFHRFEQTFKQKGNLYKETYIDISNKPIGSGPLETRGKSLKDVFYQTDVTLEAPFQKENLLDRLRRFFRASNKQLAQQLEIADVNKTGLLTNLEFRNVIKQMNFGLLQSEIDELVNICSSEGKINWKDFLIMIGFRDSDKRIIERAKIKLSHLTNLVYTYMLSPKDAFRNFDISAKGVLDFEQFQNFMAQLTYLANEDMLPYMIIKDLFDFFDKRRDNVIDLEEWMDVFAQYPYQPIVTVPKKTKPLPFINKRPNSTQDQKINLSQSHQQFMSKRQSLKLNNQKFGQIRPLTAQLLPQYEVKKVNYNGNNHIPEVVREVDTIQQVQIQRNLIQQKLGQWESSKEFDKVLNAIGRNRKFLLEIFSQISKTRQLTYDTAKDIIEQMLRTGGVHVREDGWPVLLKFAEKDGLIDYKFLLEVYKERIKRIDSHPISNNLQQQQQSN